MTKIKSTILALGAAGQFASLVVPEPGTNWQMKE
jgi:hypothetical protein